MMTSKSIRLLATKNQSHASINSNNKLNSSNQSQNLSPQLTKLSQLTDQKIIKITSEFVSSLSRQLMENSNQSQFKSMFTIREEQSYQYSSDAQSICPNDLGCQSFIDQLSTIKVDRYKQHISNHGTGKRTNTLDNLNNDKLIENPTMNSTNYNRILSEDILRSHVIVQGWEDKEIQKQQVDEVQQQQIVVLKQSQKSLNLQKMKMHKSGIVLKPNQKIQRNIDIVYSCSDREFIQIKQILQKQGIRLIQNSETTLKQKFVKAQNKKAKQTCKKSKLKFLKIHKNISPNQPNYKENKIL